MPPRYGELPSSSWALLRHGHPAEARLAGEAAERMASANPRALLEDEPPAPVGPPAEPGTRRAAGIAA